MSDRPRHRRAEELEGAQREAAVSDGGVVVAAGAGSGKTTVLAARYVRLLETGRLPTGERLHARNILVLTFTRKAAAEMYSRIYGALEAARELAGGEGGELFEHLSACLADFSQSQISTFDSFAAQVARSGSARFGLSPDFAVDEERAREMASELALSFLLEHREDEAVRELVSAVGFEGARDEVLAELAVRHMSLSSPPDFAEFHARQAERLERMAEESCSGILSMREEILRYAGARTTPTSRAWLEALAQGPGEGGGEDGDAEFLEFISRFEKLRKPSSASKDETSLFLSDAVPELKKAAAAYRDIAATRRAHPGRLALYRLLDSFREAWDRLRRIERTLTFRDVARLALDVLELDEEIREHYRGLFRHVMIDEFQDDDELQKRVLFLLAGEDRGKLFFVGDEKQSIYLFRGADVSVFKRLAGEMEEGRAPGSAALSLPRNYRSEPGLIDLINAIFLDVMREGEKPEDFEASFEPLQARPATPGVEPCLVYLELPRPEPSSPGRQSEGLRDAAEAEAWAVASLVREAVEGGSLLVADRKTGLARSARYGDFALLLRSTGNQVHFEKYFRLFEVPYGSENACGLFSEAVACDLYYALRLALYPGDRNALAAYLRSPFAGLSDEAVVRLLCSSLSPFCAEAAALLPKAELACWELGAKTVSQVSGMIDRASIATCLSFLWFEAGYRARLLRESVASAFEEHFELVHSLAVEADARGDCLASFIARLESLVGKPDKLEVELPRDSSQGVRIMTVHKSKGLEFPVVIIPQANNVGQDRAARDAWYWEESLGPSFRPPAAAGYRSRNAFFEVARERRSAMEAAELKRLLYVALTRAESQVFVTAVEPRNEDGRGRSFRSLLAPSLGLFDPPSPLARGEAGTEAPTGRGRAQGLDLSFFGRVDRLASGALVGVIPERSDREYFGLVHRARRHSADLASARAGAAGRGQVPPTLLKPEDFAPDATPGYRELRRLARPASASVSSMAEAYAARAAEGQSRPAEALDQAPGLRLPIGLDPETWGSLVHALLESRLGEGVGGLPPELLEALDSQLGAAAAREAIERAQRLASVFLDSALGRRALASPERYVELKVAIARREDGSGRRTPLARGSLDLVFIEAGRVVVVDYKTDATMNAGEHDFQVAAYKRAAAEIFGLPAEAWVFYLYGGGRALLVDADGKAPRLEDAPLAPPSEAPTFGPPPK